MQHFQNKTTFQIQEVGVEDEIQKMLKFTNGSIDRAIILLSASSGLEQGGFDLNWQDLTPVYSVNDQLKFEITESEEESANVVCAMIRIYQGTSEGYPAFITQKHMML